MAKTFAVTQLMVGLFIDVDQMLSFITILQNLAACKKLYIKSFRLKISSPLLGSRYATPTDTLAVFLQAQETDHISPMLNQMHGINPAAC